MRSKFFFIILILLFSCKNEKNKNTINNKKEVLATKTTSKKSSKDEIILKDGIKINFFKRGNGEKIEKFDVLKIDYIVRLKDGDIVDGNHLLKRTFLPFIVGFNMQTPGWDIALEQMKVGDEAEIFLPSIMARGKNGIKGLIPPNSDNFIKIKIIGKMNPTRTVDGTKVWLLEENRSEKLKANLQNSIDFHYMVSTPSNPRYDISYRNNLPYKFKFSDFGVVKGLKKALLGAKKSDKLWIFIPPSQAYGSKGLMDLIKPNEPIFYDLFIIDVR